MDDDDDFLFPDSSATKKRSNIMDELLGKSEVLENNPAKSQPFSAGNQYAPTNSQPATERRGRRGISPTLNAAPAPVEKKSGLDWLELKSDSEVNDQLISSNSKTVREEEKKAPSYLDWLTPKQNTPITTKTEERLEPKANESTNVKIAKVVTTAAPSTTQAPVPVLAKVPVPKTAPSIVEEFTARANQLGSHLNDSHSSSGTFELQSKVNHLEFEVGQLRSELENVQRRHVEELETIEASFKRRCLMVEESYQRRETQLQEEVRLLQESASGRALAWEKERAEVVSAWQRRLDECVAERVSEAERMREVQHRLLSGLKKEHEEAIDRLKNLQKTEVEAFSEAHTHTKTLSEVIDQLKSNTAELGELQSKVSVGVQSGSREMEQLLRGKEEQVAQLKAQVGVVREEEERVKTQLRNTILQLEERINRQEAELEQERWRAREERTRLEVERKAVEELRRTAAEQIESEKRNLERQKNSLLDEQRQILETQQRSILKENSLQGSVGGAEWVREETARLKELRERLESEGRVLDVRRMTLDQEKASLDALLLQLKQRSEEVEHMCLSASGSREEGFAAAREALNLEAEVKKRQEVVWGELEDVKRREKRLAEERLAVAKDRRQVELLRERLLCVRCQTNVSSTGTNSGISLTDDEFLARESHFLRKLPFYITTHRVS